MADMLSIAIKNSVILALVILIAHFLLKTSSDDRVAVVDTPRDTHPSINRHEGAWYMSNQDRREIAKENEDESEKNKEESERGDLYSYVYGNSVPTAESQTVPIPTPSCAGNSAGGIQGYESGLSDQWCLI